MSITYLPSQTSTYCDSPHGPRTSGRPGPPPRPKHPRIPFFQPFLQYVFPCKLDPTFPTHPQTLSLFTSLSTILLVKTGTPGSQSCTVGHRYKTDSGEKRTGHSILTEMYTLSNRIFFPFLLIRRLWHTSNVTDFANEGPGNVVPKDSGKTCSPSYMYPDWERILEALPTPTLELD